MKWLIVSDFIREPDSGAAGTLIEIGGALEKLGHQVDFLWKDEAPHKQKNDQMYQLFELPERQYRQIEKQMQTKPYDVVMVSQPYAYLAFEKLRTVYPQTVFMNRTHGWEGRGTMARFRFGWDYDSPKINRVFSKGMASLRQKAAHRTLAACDGFISPAGLGANYVKIKHPEFREKVKVIPYGLADHFLNAPEREVRKRDAPMKILFVGNYLPVKGVRVIEAMLPPFARQYRDMHMSFVVPKEIHSMVSHYFGDFLGRNITIHPWISRKTLVNIYQEHDLLLFPSFFEGYGKVVLEAMACGVCVLGFAEGCLPDVTQSGDAALYCETGDLVSFRTLLERCFLDKKWMREIGARAPQAVKHLTWERTAQLTEKYALELMEKKKSETPKG